MTTYYLISIAVCLLSTSSIIQSVPIDLGGTQFKTSVSIVTQGGASGDLTPSEVSQYSNGGDKSVSQYCIGGDKSAIPSATHSIDQARTLLHSVMATLVQGIETATEWKSSCNEMHPVSKYHQ